MLLLTLALDLDCLASTLMPSHSLDDTAVPDLP